jgi:hypothetical protein
MIVVVQGIFLSYSFFLIFFLSMFAFLEQKNEILFDLTEHSQWNEAFVNFELNDVNMNAARPLFIVQP